MESEFIESELKHVDSKLLSLYRCSIIMKYQLGDAVSAEEKDEILDKLDWLIHSRRIGCSFIRRMENGPLRRKWQR